MEESDDQEKTEEPSAYKIEEMRSKGYVASSKELVTFIMLLTAVFLIYFFSLYMYESFVSYFQWIATFKLDQDILREQYYFVFKETLWFFLKTVGPIFLFVFIIAIGSYLVQIGFIFSFETLNWNLDKVNPISGMQKIFSKRIFIELVKIIFKVLLVTVVSVLYIKKNIVIIKSFYYLEFFQLFIISNTLILKCVFLSVLSLSIVALIDFSWEKYTYRQKLLQSRRELKEEQKEREGNPEIRQRIRSIQREMTNKRMMKEIPESDVVIANPTHYSIVIKYDREKMMAPVVVGKGMDHLALRIRKIAEENDVPIVENPPLARSLYKTVKIGELIPKSFYKAIAEILAFVYRRKKQNEDRNAK